MDQGRILNLLREAAATYDLQRRTSIHGELGDGTAAMRPDGVFETEGRAAVTITLLDHLYTRTIVEGGASRLSRLFPAFALLCGDRASPSDIFACINWSFARPPLAVDRPSERLFRTTAVQGRIANLLLEATDAPAPRHVAILDELRRIAPLFEPDDEPGDRERVLGVRLFGDELYAQTAEHRPDLLPDLFPALAMVFAPHPESIIADINWRFAS